MERDFKGVWIPKEIWLNSNLSMLEKIIFTEISSLDNENHCIAGNEYFAQFCDCSESAVSRAITHLQELKMIEIISFDGRHRKIATKDSLGNFPKQPKQISEAAKANFRPNSIDNNKIIRKSLIDKSIRDKVPKIQEIQSFIDLYNEICIRLPKCKKSTDSRDRAIRKIIDKYSLEDIKEVLQKANGSDFLIGKNDRGWKANIDFILREDKFVSIMEDKYGGKQKRDSVSTEGHLELNRNADKKKFWEDVTDGKAEKF